MLYFRGCTAREKESNIQLASEKLLNLAGVDYHILDDEKCCGSVLLRTGFVEEAKKQIEEVKNEKNKLKKIHLFLKMKLLLFPVQDVIKL